MRMFKSIALAAMTLVAVAFSVAPAPAAELRMLISGGLTAAFKELAPEFERATGHHVTAAYGPSMGTTENAIPQRLARGEPADVLIMVGDALGKLIDQGNAVASTRVDLVRSPIGLCVRAGAPKPDIGTPDALSTALLKAKSVAYSDSASGVYVQGQLFARLGIEDEMRPCCNEAWVAGFFKGCRRKTLPIFVSGADHAFQTSFDRQTTHSPSAPSRHELARI
jgi:molybdate transport system substrate-binding protein